MQCGDTFMFSKETIFKECASGKEVNEYKL